MKKTIRNLMIAAPLATAALTLAPAAALASEPRPVIVLPPAEPKPEFDIAIPKPEPVQPKGPGDIAPAPKPDKPKGPGDITNPDPCPTHGVDCTPDDDDEPTGGNDGGDGGSDSSDDASDAFSVPTRIDAGLASSDEQSGVELTWLLASGALVTASGAAFAARNRMRRNA